MKDRGGLSPRHVPTPTRSPRHIAGAGGADTDFPDFANYVRGLRRRALALERLV